MGFTEITQRYTAEPKISSLCSWPYSKIFISSDDRVVPCCHISNPDYFEIGDGLSSEFSALDSWFSEEYQGFRDSHTNGNIPNACSSFYKLKKLFIASSRMARPAIIVGNYEYSGTDAHRTLLSVDSLWGHHMHDVKRDPNRVASVGAELVKSIELLADLHGVTPELELGARLEMIGESAASKIDELDPQKLTTWLGGLWPVLAKLHSADTQNPAMCNIGKVVGIQASTNSVPKTSIAHGIVNYGGLDSDRQMARTHHGRPWQALCIWSDEVIAKHTNAGHPIARGSTGENIPISEIDWSKVRPGATLEFGSVKTKITGYAIPCKKNARWFSDGDYQRLSHELGAVSRVYCLVTQPGSVSVGDIATCK